jgi:predicted pyridoxine 5'-phosphate oxidase superfamily flavin-nucleotide-binding protein
MEGINPKCVIVITVERAYTQCQKAIVRSRLWDPAVHIAKSKLTTPGEMMERLSQGDFHGKA